MHFKKSFLLFTTCITLCACSSNNFKQIPYGCDGDESDPYCASVSKIFDNSVDNDHRNINVLAEDMMIKRAGDYNTIQSQGKIPLDSGSALKTDNAIQGAQLNTVGVSALETRPVYTPEKVHRIFRGPWKDDFNILHSGEHLFYRTPGYWTFGNMNEPGSASGLITPVYPEDLGFTGKVDPSAEPDQKRVGRHTVTTNKQGDSQSPKKMN